MSKDIGNKCVDCFKDTSFGSGRFVNRIPADNGVYDGYQCPDCQMIECDKCDELTLEYIMTELGMVYCDDCHETINKT